MEKGSPGERRVLDVGLGPAPAVIVAWMAVRTTRLFPLVFPVVATRAHPVLHCRAGVSGAGCRIYLEFDQETMGYRRYQYPPCFRLWRGYRIRLWLPDVCIDVRPQRRRICRQPDDS